MRPSVLLTPSWGKVPATPVLELMVPTDRATELGGAPRLVSRTPGQQVTIAIKPDTTAAGLLTYRVEVSGAVAGPLELSLVGASGPTSDSWTLDVDPAWVAPPPAVAPVPVTHAAASWTCSHTRTANLSFDGAAWAYRVVTASSKGDLDQGKTRAFVVPRSMGLFFRRASSGPPPDVNVELGFSNCFGDTFDWAGSVIADVFALLPDGSEQRVTRAPVAIAAP
jgi:hypothetical protein